MCSECRGTELMRVKVDIPGQRQITASCLFSLRVQDAPNNLGVLRITPRVVRFGEGKRFDSHRVRLSSETDHSTGSETAEIRDAVKVEFFASLLANTTNSDASDINTAYFLLPLRGGYLIHSEFMVHRLASCGPVVFSESFVSPLSWVAPFELVDPFALCGIRKALESSIGAISCLQINAAQVEAGLRSRLNIEWCLEDPIRQRRIAVVTDPENLLVTRKKWEALAALGIKCVIFSEGSWWANGRGINHGLRESFIDLDLTPNGELSRRIVAAVNAYPFPIDGVLSISDKYVLETAKAAQTLNMFAMSPEALEISTDKYLTSQLLGGEAAGITAVCSLEQLDEQLVMDAFQFPIVGKPASGNGSQGVFKAIDAVDFRQKAAKSLAHNKSKHGLLIEPYINGPEVDVNFVLLDGKLLYSEIVDDFPSAADLGLGELFVETQSVIPSAMPEHEQKVAIEAMLDVVLKQGFSTGVFHCEARLRNSCMTYVLSAGSNIPELQVAGGESPKHPSAFLHEVNPRPPGVMSTAASFCANGVDYWALAALCCVQDWDRYKALAVPFNFDGVQRDHTMCLATVTPVSAAFVQEVLPSLPAAKWHRGIIGGPRDPIPELLQHDVPMQRAILRHNSFIGSARCYGFDHEGWILVACVVIRSDVNRKHLLKLSERFSGEFEALLHKRDAHSRVCASY